MFWLYLNKDRLFSSPKKIALTILNVIIIGIAACIVSILSCYHQIISNHRISAVSDSTYPAVPFTTTPIAAVSLVPVMLRGKV